MRAVLFAAVAAASLSIAGAAAAAAPYDGSDVLVGSSGHYDLLIGTPGGPFLLNVKVDLSLLGSPMTGALGQHINRYWQDPFGWVYEEGGLEDVFAFDPTVHSAYNFSAYGYTSPTRTFDVRPTADGFQLAYFGGDNHCYDGRTGQTCSQHDKVWAVSLYGLAPTGESLPVSWTFSAAPPLSAVPEPAAWAMMIAGFGLAGAALRRRRRVRPYRRHGELGDRRPSAETAPTRSPRGILTVRGHLRGICGRWRRRGPVLLLGNIGQYRGG